LPQKPRLIVRLIVVMNAVLYKPIRSILIEREKKVASLETDIETFEKNSQLRIEEFDKKLADARKAAQSEFETVKSEAQAETNQKLAGVRKEADAEKADHLSQIEKQFVSAQDELKGQIDSFAGDMAGRILGRAV